MYQSQLTAIVQGSTQYSLGTVFSCACLNILTHANPSDLVDKPYHCTRRPYCTHTRIPVMQRLRWRRARSLLPPIPYHIRDLKSKCTTIAIGGKQYPNTQHHAHDSDPHQKSFSCQRCSCPTQSPGTVMGQGHQAIMHVPTPQREKDAGQAMTALLQQAPKSTADGGREGNSQWLLQN
jgi:hypothetical protein